MIIADILETNAILTVVVRKDWPQVDKIYPQRYCDVSGHSVQGESLGLDRGVFAHRIADRAAVTIHHDQQIYASCRGRVLEMDPETWTVP